MPSLPPISEDQRKALQKQAALAQKEVLSISNQITILESSIKSVQDAANAYLSRYGFWNNYIFWYLLEIEKMLGTYLNNPITFSDFNNFLEKKGRLYSPSSNSPVRIAEFDGNNSDGNTYTYSIYEQKQWTEYDPLRDVLINGETNLSVPTNTVLSLIGPIGPIGPYPWTGMYFLSIGEPPPAALSGSIFIFGSSNAVSGQILNYFVYKAYGEWEGYLTNAPACYFITNEFVVGFGPGMGYPEFNFNGFLCKRNSLPPKSYSVPQPSNIYEATGDCFAIDTDSIFYKVDINGDIKIDLIILPTTRSYTIRITTDYCFGSGFYIPSWGQGSLTVPASSVVSYRSLTIETLNNYPANPVAGQNPKLFFRVYVEWQNLNGPPANFSIIKAVLPLYESGGITRPQYWFKTSTEIINYPVNGTVYNKFNTTRDFPSGDFRNYFNLNTTLTKTSQVIARFATEYDLLDPSIRDQNIPNLALNMYLTLRWRDNFVNNGEITFKVFGMAGNTVVQLGEQTSLLLNLGREWEAQIFLSTMEETRVFDTLLIEISAKLDASYPTPTSAFNLILYWTEIFFEKTLPSYVSFMVLSPLIWPPFGAAGDSVEVDINANISIPSVKQNEIYSGSGFSNEERTNNTPNDPRLKTIYDAQVLSFKNAIIPIRDFLAEELQLVNQIASVSNDEPDLFVQDLTTGQPILYKEGLEQKSNALNSYLNANPIDVSDAGLALIDQIRTLRLAEIEPRKNYIRTRLSGSSTAYNSRYNYADKLYNLVDGQYTMLRLLEDQKARLAAQQGVLAAKAQDLTNEANL